MLYRFVRFKGYEDNYADGPFRPGDILFIAVEGSEGELSAFKVLPPGGKVKGLDLKCDYSTVWPSECDPLSDPDLAVRPI